MPELDPDREPDAPVSWRERLDLIARPPRLAPMPPSQLGLAVAGVLVALLAAWFLLRQPAGPPAEATIPRAGAGAATAAGAVVGPAPTTTVAPAVVLAHAAGAVRAPGVYSLTTGARVKDLLDAAGGPAIDADLERLNLAAPLVDGSQVFVPRLGQVVPPAAGAGAPPVGGGPAVPAGPVDLNTATLEQLDALPGVGPATATAILAERDKRGAFGSVDDLLDVRGIGPAKFEALQDLVTV